MMIPGYWGSLIAYSEVLLKQLVDEEMDATCSGYPIGCLLVLTTLRFFQSPAILIIRMRSKTFLNLSNQPLDLNSSPQCVETLQDVSNKGQYIWQHYVIQQWQSQSDVDIKKFAFGSVLNSTCILSRFPTIHICSVNAIVLSSLVCHHHGYEMWRKTLYTVHFLTVWRLKHTLYFLGDGCMEG